MAPRSKFKYRPKNNKARFEKRSYKPTAIKDEEEEEYGKKNKGLERVSENDQPLNGVPPETHVKQENGEENEDAEKAPDKSKTSALSKQSRARLIIRNLSFKITEEKLKNHFVKYGDVIDVNVLRRVDGLLIGCGFVEFAEKKNAAKAIVETSGKLFLGRTIIVDWAIPKHEFQKANSNQRSKREPKVEMKDKRSSDQEIKEEEDDDDEEEDDDDDEEEEDIKEIKKVKSDDESEDSDRWDVNEASDNYNFEFEFDDKKDVKPKMEKVFKEEKPVEEKRPRFESHDVAEGKTVFIRNVPFSVEKEELRQLVVELFGPVFYALICIDPVTEHSKGTAFVKFRNKEDAEKCLNAGTEFAINGTVLNPYPAIDRQKLKEKKAGEKEKVHDARNLYLAKEGVVLAGTVAAEGVSMPDMSKRLQLEQWKSNVLKDLHKFVSRNRLVIHNLPIYYDDKRLRALFLQHSRKGAVIKEAHVMRDLNKIDKNGKGTSKGYGFVTFTEFLDALQALRTLNNNPEIFTELQRPIVGFSIEDRRILNIKQRRVAKSRAKDPNCPEYNPQARVLVRPDSKRDRKRNNKMTLFADREFLKRSGNKEAEVYHGVAAKPGLNKTRSKYKLTVQGQVHAKTVKKSKSEMRSAKRQKINATPIRQEKQTDVRNAPNKASRRKLEDDDHFNSLVKKYKKQLQTSKKWYE